MGIDSAGAQFLVGGRSAGVDFSNTATLGRQAFNASGSGLEPVAQRLRVRGGAEELAARCGRSGDRFLEELGANTVTSFDLSDYEGASVTHDFNEAIPEEQHARFSAVVDGGTIEHVFNVGQALKNCMEMVRFGGHFLGIQAGNNFLGHGFYQLSPEFYFRTLTPTNGFRLLCVLVCRVEPPAFYGVRDLRQHYELINSQPTYTLAIAQRTAVQPVLLQSPQQGDFESAWAGPPKPAAGRAQDPGLESMRDSVLRQVKATMPDWVKLTARRALRRQDGTGFDQACFYPVSTDRLLSGDFGAADNASQET